MAFQSRHVLPLAWLTDAVQIDMWPQSLGARVVLGQRASLPAGLHLDYAAGLGVTRLNAATHLQSAVLDVRGRSLQTLPYGVAEGRIAGPTGPTLLGSMWVFSSGAKAWRQGLEQAFQDNAELPSSRAKIEMWHTPRLCVICLGV